jgi:methylthioribose-1-phosphate isomerase
VTAPGLRPVRLTGNGAAVRIIDQRLLPAEYVERDLTTLDEIIEAIVTLAVRGAPAIGVCAAAGLAVVMREHGGGSRADFLAALDACASRLVSARPTAVNLAWAVERCVARVRASSAEAPALVTLLAREARALCDEDLAMGDAIGAYGLALLRDPVRVLTHCNAGALATAGAGTALAPVYAAHAEGRVTRVFATETRPLLQGARLTAWELQHAGIAVTVLVDGAAAALMRAGEVDAVLVGADRIAANGDVANKVGTYALAVAAAHHAIPFYVLAPWSTVDASTPDGSAIPIEMRSRDELEFCGGVRILADGAAVWAPAFDITPATLITAIVTDRGTRRPPYDFTRQ